MKQSKKGNRWYFGTKTRIGVDAKSGLGHTVRGTRWQCERGGRGKQPVAHTGNGRAGRCRVPRRIQATGCQRWRDMARGHKAGQAQSTGSEPAHRSIEGKFERTTASIRVKAEHPFGVTKRHFGHTKVRCRGLAKNMAELHVLFALANLWMARRRLQQVMA